MPRRTRPWTAHDVAALRKAGRYPVGGVDGLMLRITSARTRTWVCRVMVNGVRRDLRLGRYPDMSLSQARDAAHDVHRAIRDGVPPQANLPSRPVPEPPPVKHAFRQAAIDFMAFKGAEWKNAKHRQQWRNTLATYAYPLIGDVDVADLTLEHVLAVLKPIWLIKNETASRVRMRIEAVLDYATVHKWRSGDNPARWRGRLDKTLPSPGKVKTVRHHPALPFEAMPALMQRLVQETSVSAQALLLTILTAARSGEVRYARWDEFNMESGVWTISPARMKSNREHTVPLSRQAVRLLTSIPRQESGYLFPPEKNRHGTTTREPVLSDMAMTELLRGWGVPAVPHGFRSTFEDWVGDETGYDGELADFALAHAVRCKTKAAYRRKSAAKRRRPMMQDWADAILPDHARRI